MNRKSLLCVGFGYSARTLARKLDSNEYWSVAGTTRSSEKAAAMKDEGVDAVIWPGSDLSAEIGSYTHILVSVPPGETGDVVVNSCEPALANAAAGKLEWLGYLSTTAVYGDRGGGWVDEASGLRPSTRRGQLRVEAELSWLDMAKRYKLPVHIFRLAGIYGPGRGPLAQLAAGRKKRIIKAGQVFNRIHVEDIARILKASMESPRPGSTYNVCDDMPAQPQFVTSYCAQLLGVPEPEAVAFEEADLSPMARSFYSESKRVSNCRVKHELNIELAYPDYLTGLKSLSEEMNGQSAEGQADGSNNG